MSEIDDEYNPPVDQFTVLLEDRDDDLVAVTVQAPGCARWAKFHQTIAGERWETDGPDLAYALFSAGDTRLVDEMQGEGYKLDLSQYTIPE